MSRRFLVSFVAVLLLVPSLGWAAESSLSEWVQNKVQEGIIKPLARQRSRGFSRSRPPPQQRRARVLSSALLRDKAGRGFVPFAVDIRHGSEWHEDVVGCAYRDSGKLFVKVGDSYRPAAFLLGKNVEPVAGVCKAEPARS